MFQSVKNMCGVFTRRNHQKCGHQNIARLKPTNEVQAFLIGFSLIGETHILTQSVKTRPLYPQVGTNVMAHSDRAYAPRDQLIGKCVQCRVVNVDDSGPIIRQHAIKKPRLGLKIGIECLVIIQVVLGKIRKPRRLDAHTIQAPLIQSVRGCLHRGMGDACGFRLGQHAMQS